MSKLSKEIKEYISCPQINGKPYGRWGALNSQQRIKIWNLAHQCEVFESVADDCVKKLDNYMRIFRGREVQVYPKFGGNIQYVITLNKEEYEMLEELM